MAIKTEGEETSWLTLSKEIERGFTCQRNINFRGDAPPQKKHKGCSEWQRDINEHHVISCLMGIQTG